MSKPKPTQIDQNEADHISQSYNEAEDPQQHEVFPEDILDSATATDLQPPDATLYGGDVDAGQEQTDAGEETVGGSSPTPDQDVVEELGRAMGITYEDNEPLRFGDKLADRDAQRWELNPASSEDYGERSRDLSGDGKSAAQQTFSAKRPLRAPPNGGSASQSGRPAGARARKAHKHKR